MKAVIHTYTSQEPMLSVPGYVWLTVPFSILTSWVFHTMQSIGDYSENPFEGLNNDIPITSICRTIEIDILEMIDDVNVPLPMSLLITY